MNKELYDDEKVEMMKKPDIFFLLFDARQNSGNHPIIIFLEKNSFRILMQFIHYLWTVLLNENVQLRKIGPNDNCLPNQIGI